MSRIRYSEELKRHILSEVAAGASVAQLARDYDPCAATIHHCLREHREPDDGDDRRSPRERELEKQVVYLERQVTFLKKAASWFARECETDPGGMRRID